MNPIRIMIPLVLLLASVASVAACETPKKTVADFIQALPQGKVFVLKEAKAQRFLEAFNASPPTTDITGDTVLLTITPLARGVAHLHIFEAGCIKQRGRISRRLIDRLMEMFDKGGRHV